MSDREPKGPGMDSPVFQQAMMQHLGPVAGLIEQFPFDEFLEGLAPDDSDEFLVKHWRKGFLGTHRGRPFHPRLKRAWVNWVRKLGTCAPEAKEMMEAAEEAMRELGPKGSRIIMPPE